LKICKLCIPPTYVQPRQWWWWWWWWCKTISHLNVAGHHGRLLHHGVHNIKQISGRRANLSQVNWLRYAASEVDQRIGRLSTNTNVIIVALQSNTTHNHHHGRFTAEPRLAGSSGLFQQLLRNKTCDEKVAKGFFDHALWWLCRAVGLLGLLCQWHFYGAWAVA